MATGYHLNVSVVSRGQGQSVIAKAAYNAREELSEERTAQVKDYTRKQDRAVWSGIFADKTAPAWAQDREKLWNAADAFEKRKDAQIAYNIIAALPHQLTDRQREFIAKDFAREQFLRRGVVADVNIHAPDPKGDDRNHHVHILVSMREMTPEGFGKRRVLTWDEKEENLARWREHWGARCARELEKAGHQIEADRWREGHRTLEQQSRAARERGDAAYAETLENRKATKHRGPAVDAMERRGVATDRGNVYRETHTAAQETAKLKRELAEVQRQITALERGAPVTRTPRRSPEVRTVPISPIAAARQAVNDNKRAVARIGRAGGKAGRQAAKLGGAALHALADAIESLFTPATPKTPAQIEADQRRVASAANDHESAFAKYARDTEHERAQARQMEEARLKETAREQYERLERGRGGRER